MKRLLSSILVILIVSMNTFTAYADINSLMDEIVSGVNVTKPGIYKSPSRTTATLGSMSFRLNTPTLPSPLVTFTPPSATLSCAGADLDAGQISILNLDMIGDMVGNFGGSVAWGLMLGLVYSTPGISESLGKLNEITRWIQMLNQSPCEIGIAAGQAIGEEIWNTKTKKTAENTMGSGTFSVFNQAMKKVNQNMEMQDIFQTFPYGVLQKAGISDKEVMNLFGSWYGIANVYLADSTGKRLAYTPTTTLSTACDGNPCTSENIVVKEHSSLLSDIDVFIYGGTTKLYSCNGSVISGVCSGDIVVNDSAYVNGMKASIVQNMKVLRNGLTTPYGGTGSISSTTITNAINNQDNASTLFTYAAMIPNFYDMLSYSALLSKSNDPSLVNVSDEILNSMAEVMSFRLIDKFFSMSYEYLNTAQTADSKLLSNATKLINEYNKNARKSYQNIENLMRKANDRANFYMSAAQRYQTYYDYTSKKLVTNMEGLTLKR